MDNELFPSELDYQGALSLAEGMRRSGLLNDDELSKVRSLLVEAYDPPLGSLFAIPGGTGDGETHTPNQHIQEDLDATRTM